jgi:hypothetical protein
MGVNYALAGPQFNALEALQAYGRGQQMAYQQQDWQRRQTDFDRQDEARGALSQLVMTGMKTQQPAPGGSLINGAERSPDIGGGGRSPLSTSPRDDAFARLAAADPQAAMAYQARERAATKEQIAIFHDVNRQALQMLGGVRDQASYDAAKTRAAALYGRYGLTLDEYNLPDEYSPETVRGLMMQAIDTDKQLSQLRADRKLDADIADDEADNARADRNADSVDEDRKARRGLTARGQDMSDVRGRYGIAVASSDRRRGQDLSHEDRIRAQDRRPVSGGRGRLVAPNNPPSMIPGATPQMPVTVTTAAQAKMLPKGTYIRTPSGKVLRVP